MITLEICQKQPSDIITMTPRGTLGLSFVHIDQLMTLRLFTGYLAVMLQASWHTAEES